MIQQKKIALLSMLFIAYASQAQLQFLNKETSEPVSNVKIFNQKGEILEISNYEGFTEPENLKISKNDTLNIFHYDFKPKNLTLTEVLEKNEIFLTPSTVKNLEQVIITAKKPRYLKITGYFISYQLIDKTAQSFLDGIIEYYIDLKKDNFKEYNIKSSRLFKNNQLIKQLKKKKGKVINLVGSNILPFSFEEEILINEWKNSDEKFESILNGDKVGIFNQKDKNSDITLEYYTPENPREISLLGLSTIVSHHLIREKFKSSIPKIENLESISKFYSSEMTKKGQSIDYELEQDFFVSNVKYLNKEQFKSETDEVNHQLNSQSTSDFWVEYLDNIPPSIKNKLNKELEITAL